MRKGLLGLFILLVGTVVFESYRLGSVNQGQVVAYDQASGLLTLIQDSNYRDPSHPRFDVFPAVTLSIPRDPDEMGAPPAPGLLLAIDREARKLMVFDGSNVKAIPYTLVQETPQRGSCASFPRVDRAGKTVVICSPHDHLLITASLEEQYLALPDEHWKFGDEVRYYYKEPGQALRLMNVSQTDLANLQ